MLEILTFSSNNMNSSVIEPLNQTEGDHSIHEAEIPPPTPYNPYPAHPYARFMSGNSQPHSETQHLP
ncbi:hypothetical protein VTO58DRAFT_103274 [Aureobasidium pullulans]